MAGREIVRQGKRNLTVIANDTATPGNGFGKLIDAGLVSRVIASHIGLNPETQKQMIAGRIAVDLVPQGTLVERIRAGGCGLGGVLTPMALAHGRLFVPVVDLCMRGSAIGYEPFSGVDYARRGRGELTAIDARTGRRLWTRRLPSPVFGCATTAGDVVFTTTYAGRAYAFDQATGKELWSVKEPAGANACPAVAGPSATWVAKPVRPMISGVRS